MLYFNGKKRKNKKIILKEIQTFLFSIGMVRKQLFFHIMYKGMSATVFPYTLQ